MHSPEQSHNHDELELNNRRSEQIPSGEAFTAEQLEQYKQQAETEQLQQQQARATERQPQLAAIHQELEEIYNQQDNTTNETESTVDTAEITSADTNQTTKQPRLNFTNKLKQGFNTVRNAIILQRYRNNPFLALEKMTNVSDGQKQQITEALLNEKNYYSLFDHFDRLQPSDEQKQQIIEGLLNQGDYDQLFSNFDKLQLSDEHKQQIIEWFLNRGDHFSLFYYFDRLQPSDEHKQQIIEGFLNQRDYDQLLSNFDKLQLSDEHKQQIIEGLLNQGDYDQLFSNFDKLQLSDEHKQQIIEGLLNRGAYRSLLYDFDRLQPSDEQKQQIIEGLLNRGDYDQLLSNSDKLQPADEQKQQIIEGLLNRGDYDQLLSNSDRLQPSDEQKQQIIEGLLNRGDYDQLLSNSDRLQPSDEQKQQIIEGLLNQGDYRSLLDYSDKLQLSDEHKQQIIESAIDKKLFHVLSKHLYKLDPLPELSDQHQKIIKIIAAIAQSNASELVARRESIVEQVMSQPDPLQALHKVESIYLRNNLPEFAKRQLIFEALTVYNYQDQDYQAIIRNSPKVSPVLKQHQHRLRYILSADLAKAACGSNNRNLKQYLESLSAIEPVIAKVDSNQALSADESSQLQHFLDKMVIIQDESNLSRQANFDHNLTDQQKVAELKQLFAVDNDQSISDKIAKMFGFTLGLKTIDQVKAYIADKTHQATERGRYYYQHPEALKLQQGDYIKGVNIRFIENILSNGSLSKEFLGEAAHSDTTPFDTDITKVLTTPEGTLAQIIRDSPSASQYGNVHFILKGGSRFQTTRVSTADSEIAMPTASWARDKLEVFHTGDHGATHYGIRTGFASSEIDAITFTPSPDNLAKDILSLEITKNGFYIPLVNLETEQIEFSPDDYQKLRQRMSGLSYYDNPIYQFAEQLRSNPASVDQIKRNIEVVNQQRQAINQTITQTVEQLSLSLKQPDGTLMPGLELIDTGSTGRHTDVPGSNGDFDFIMRIDRTDFINPELMNQLRQQLQQDLQPTSSTDGRGLRLKQCRITGLDQPVDIDITFVIKTNKMDYSTDQCLQDRLTNIKQQDSDKYYQVLANIVEAKQLLKQAKAYKKRTAADNPQGGLGGVGVENWILQNGGSLLAAAKDFMTVAKNKDFAQFKHAYKIYDFGKNHIKNNWSSNEDRAPSDNDRNDYPHDEFVYANMNADGYNKMKQTLAQFLMEQGQTY